MNLDHLIRREHEERRRAAAAAGKAARAAHIELADLYRARIAAARGASDAEAVPEFAPAT